MEFEWDEAKASANLLKHGVSFPLAPQVSSDAHLLIDEDRNARSESRGRAIGLFTSGILFVVFTERHDDVIRIISARKATPHERKAYYAVP